jgi:hypothetical protein
MRACDSFKRVNRFNPREVPSKGLKEITWEATTINLENTDKSSAKGLDPTEKN